jgi:hypothetical protein
MKNRRNVKKESVVGNQHMEAEEEGVVKKSNETIHCFIISYYCVSLSVLWLPKLELHIFSI